MQQRQQLAKVVMLYSPALRIRWKPYHPSLHKEKAHNAIMIHR